MGDATSPAPVLSYATPAALDQRGVWREGDLIVKPPGVPMPTRCVVCNEVDAETTRATFRYVPLFRLVVRSVFRNIAVPLCVAHRERANERWWTSMGLRVGGVVMMLSGVAFVADGIISSRVMGVLFVLSLAMLWQGDRLSRTYTGLKLVNVSRGRLYFSGAGREFLDSLPEPTETSR